MKMKGISIAAALVVCSLSMSAYAKDANDASTGSQMTVIGQGIEGDFSSQVPVGVIGGDRAITGGSRAITGGSRAITGGSRAITGGSRAITGGSRAITGGSRAITGGSRAITGGSR